MYFSQLTVKVFDLQINANAIHSRKRAVTLYFQIYFFFFRSVNVKTLSECSRAENSNLSVLFRFGRSDTLLYGRVVCEEILAGWPFLCQFNHYDGQSHKTVSTDMIF